MLAQGTTGLVGADDRGSRRRRAIPGGCTSPRDRTMTRRGVAVAAESFSRAHWVRSRRYADAPTGAPRSTLSAPARAQRRFPSKGGLLEAFIFWAGPRPCASCDGNAVNDQRRMQRPLPRDLSTFKLRIWGSGVRISSGAPAISRAYGRTTVTGADFRASCLAL
jgi:hypothetical protein